MKRSTLTIIVTAILFIAGLVLTVSSSASREKQESPSCCKYGTDCGEKAKKSGSGELIMENMSRQFISI